jgi:hypothetical protein
MKTLNTKVKIIMILFCAATLAAALFCSCSLEKPHYGTLVINLPGSDSGRAVGALISPAFTATLRYQIECSGPGNVSRDFSGSSVSIPLNAGTWNITVEVLNAAEQNIAIANNTATVTIEGGKTSTIKMAVGIDTEQNDITTFAITDPVSVTGEIKENAITVSIPEGTDITKMEFSATHTGRSIEPATGPLNLTNPQSITVTAENGDKKTYTVSVSEGTSSGRLTIDGLQSDGQCIVYIFASGTDISTIDALDDLDKVQVVLALGLPVSGGVFPLYSVSGVFNDNPGLGNFDIDTSKLSPWTGSGSLPVLLIREGPNTFEWRWATVSFSDGNGTVNINSFKDIDLGNYSGYEGNDLDGFKTWLAGVGTNNPGKPYHVKLDIDDSSSSSGGGSFGSSINSSSLGGILNLPANSSKYISLDLSGSKFYNDQVNGSFTNCATLTGIDLPNPPNAVTEIIADSFLGCNNLVYVNMIDNVTSIGASAFEGCTNLTYVSLPPGLRDIRDKAFMGCTSLGLGDPSVLTIPAFVSYIGSEAFSGCTGLTAVMFTTKMIAKTFKDDAFMSSLVTAYEANGAGMYEFSGGWTKDTTAGYYEDGGSGWPSDDILSDYGLVGLPAALYTSWTIVDTTLTISFNTATNTVNNNTRSYLGNIQGGTSSSGWTYGSEIVYSGSNYYFRDFTKDNFILIWVFSGLDSKASITVLEK